MKMDMEVLLTLRYTIDVFFEEMFMFKNRILKWIHRIVNGQYNSTLI